MMTTTAGYGRTGNYIISINRAMQRAHQCKTLLELPMEDAMSHAFFPPANSTIFNFSSRPGDRHPACLNASIGIGLSGDAKTFWHLPRLDKVSAAEIAFYDAYSEESHEIDTCLRLYLGICEKQYCEGFQTSENSLVVHIRQGDIFRSNHSANVHHGYGQPPVSYYLSAIGHQPWDEVIVVAQNTTDVSPLWLDLRLLSDLDVFKMPVKFVSSDWSSDLRLLMCARNLVEAKTTLEVMTRLGFAERYYRHSCFSHYLPTTTVYAIHTVGGYEPYSFHDNSEKEWLDMLLHDAFSPEECQSTFSITRN